MSLFSVNTNVGAMTALQNLGAISDEMAQVVDRADAWRKRLIEALALVEARIDFSDEADVPEDLVGPALHAAQRYLGHSPARPWEN